MAKFTDRFVRIPVNFISEEEFKDKLLSDDFLDDSETLSSFIMVNPFKIQHYEPSIPQGFDIKEENAIWTNFGLETGEEFLSRITVAEFEDLLNNHNQ